MVKKGQLLATIDPRPFEIALQQAIGARHARRGAARERRASQLQRYQTLLGQDSIARQDVDTQAALVKQLEGTVVIDRANEKHGARSTSATRRIVAPVAGRVGLRTVDTGNYIGAGDANGVAVITQLTPIDVAVRGAAGPRARDPGAASPRARTLAGRPRCDRTRTQQARRRHLLDARQPGRHADRHRQGQGALRQRRRRRCSRTSSSTCGCCCARSTARSSCR